MVSEGFGLAGLVVRLPLQLDKHRRGLLQVLVSILRSLEHDGELTTENTSSNRNISHYILSQYSAYTDIFKSW